MSTMMSSKFPPPKALKSGKIFQEESKPTTSDLSMTVAHLSPSPHALSTPLDFDHPKL
jgi:hypothetical protein